MDSRKMFCCAAILAAALVAGAQEQGNKVVKHVPIKPTSAASGEEMYNTYCAVCHAKDG